MNNLAIALGDEDNREAAHYVLSEGVKDAYEPSDVRTYCNVL